MNFKCVEVPLIDNPQGIDKPIQDLQVLLGTIPWMAFAFGKAFTRKEIRDEEAFIIPKVYQAKKEYLSMEPTDEVAAFCFFEIVGDEVISNFEPLQLNFTATNTVSLIVWANLKMIDDTRDYIFHEELKNDVMQKIQLASIHSVLSIERGLESAYSSYTVGNQDDKFINENFVALKFNLEIIYNQPCIVAATFNLTTC